MSCKISEKEETLANWLQLIAPKIDLTRIIGSSICNSFLYSVLFKFVVIKQRPCGLKQLAISK